ncbi:hypothetical protein D1872_258590 [compost metagenome]
MCANQAFRQLRHTIHKSLLRSLRLVQVCNDNDIPILIAKRVKMFFIRQLLDRSSEQAGFFSLRTKNGHGKMRCRQREIHRSGPFLELPHGDLPVQPAMKNVVLQNLHAVRIVRRIRRRNVMKLGDGIPQRRFEFFHIDRLEQVIFDAKLHAFF